ncbi:topoisomerase DNA-binding C4 zinc finger domain-containing protein [Octadecabacter antarcticus]
MVKQKGRFGGFFGCMKYPKCTGLRWLGKKSVKAS